MNDDDRKRLLKFAFLCFPTRLAFAVAAYFLGKKAEEKKVWYTYIFGISLFAIGISLCFFQFLRDTGKREKVGFSGGQVYWNSYVHGSLWIIAGILFFAQPRFAWTILTADLLLGLSLVVYHYINKG